MVHGRPCVTFRCDGLVTPEVLRVRYNLSAFRPATGKATQAVAQFLEQYYSPADLTGFIEARPLYFHFDIVSVISHVFSAPYRPRPGRV